MIDSESRGNAGVVLGLTADQMVGFNIPYWIKCLQAGALVMLGRFSDADDLLARLFQTDPADAEPRPGQMSAEEARELLDSQKGEERHALGLPVARRTPDAPPDKPVRDW